MFNSFSSRDYRYFKLDKHTYKHLIKKGLTTPGHYSTTYYNYILVSSTIWMCGMCVTPSIVYFIPLYSQVDYHGSAFCCKESHSSLYCRVSLKASQPLQGIPQFSLLQSISKSIPTTARNPTVHSTAEYL